MLTNTSPLFPKHHRHKDEEPDDHFNMSTEQKDALSRWLPALVAVIAIVGNILWLGAKAGTIEQRVESNEKTISQSVRRDEYEADKRASTARNEDNKQALRDINAKLDRLIEQRSNRNQN